MTTFRERVAAEATALFGYATGWLGWTPNEARHTSIYHMLIAMDGLLARFDATVPGFARRHDDEATGAPPLNADGTLDREAVSAKIKIAFNIFICNAKTTER